MRWSALVTIILLLSGCCNGSGLGPRAAIDTEPNHPITIERIS
ncbi:hypothetical protein [Vibrio sp. DW001]|nr:hypothetical protein [Vibrio sp. DW001]